MKKIKNLAKILIVIFAITLTMTVVAACSPKSTDNRVELKMATFENKNAAITYNKTDTYLGADNVEYRNGSIKPVWTAIEKNLDVKITDVAKSYDDRNKLWQAFSQDFTGFDFIVLTADNAVMYAENFLDLRPYLDNDTLPNIKAQMEKSDIIEQSVITNGKMTYVPYFDGFDDIERTMILRSDWVKALLDSENVDSFDSATVSELQFGYQPYIASYDNVSLKIVDPSDSTKTKTIVKNVASNDNIIAQINKATDKSGKNLANILREYIKTTYSSVGYTNLSDLFLSSSAAYDTDELIALLKVVKANPAYLTGNASTNIVPIYPREEKNQRTTDIFRLAQIFGLRGTESRLSYFYVDENGNIQDSRLQEDTYDTLSILNTLYKDGLILQDFANKDGSTAYAKTDPTTGLKDKTIRGYLNVQNRGFLTYDYVQTTVALNDYITADTKLTDSTFKNYKDFELQPIIPPFTTWGKEENVSRHTDSWRSVKNSGWAINAKVAKDKVKLAKALELADYLFSEEGAKLMSYGPSEWLDGDKTINYNGKEVPKISQKTLDEINTLAGGSYTNYYRQYLGATMPIGYIKEQGMEYQTTAEAGKTGLDNISKAIELGTMTHLVVDSSEIGDNKSLQIIPSALSVDDSYIERVKTKTTNFASQFSSESSTYNNVFARVIINGFGYNNNDAETGTPTRADAVSYYKSDKIGGDIYFEAYQDAFDYLFGLNKWKK